jgi:hypothetical protein
VTDACDTDEPQQTVFRVARDPERYQVLGFDPPPPIETSKFDGTPKGQTWTTQVVRPYERQLVAPDIWFVAGAFTIAMPPRVVSLLDPFVSAAGELLPLEVAGSGEELLALNILRTLDCVDPELSVARPDMLGFSLVFLPDRLPRQGGLFKVPLGGLAVTEIFFVDPLNAADSLRARVDSLGLTGLSFERVWSPESDAAVIKDFWFLFDL